MEHVAACFGDRKLYVGDAGLFHAQKGEGITTDVPSEWDAGFIPWQAECASYLHVSCDIPYVR